MNEEKIENVKDIISKFNNAILEIEHAQELLQSISTENEDDQLISNVTKEICLDLEKPKNKIKTALDMYENCTHSILEEERDHYVTEGMRRICEAWDYLIAEIGNATEDVEKNVHEANTHEQWDLFFNKVQFTEPRKSKMMLENTLKDFENKCNKKYK